MNGLGQMLGTAGEPPRCKPPFIHWFTVAKPGSRCLCGQTEHAPKKTPRPKPRRTEGAG